MKLYADLFLIHAPSVYDFRERDDILFAYLSDSDSVNVTSIFEMYPMGYLSIKAKLLAHGIDVKIVNLASLMLQNPKLNVDKLLSNLEAPAYGLDLHWLAHCHGSIEIARRIKRIHPDSLIIFGGISATYFADELIQYPPVDIVVRGYDTLEPVTNLINSIKQGGREFCNIPNLIYKNTRNEIIDTGFTHKPTRNYNDVPIDWSFYKQVKSDLTTTKLIMTLPNSGCEKDCPWCGGSHYTYRNLMGLSKTLVEKDMHHIECELRTLGERAKMTSIYALQCYSESKERLNEYLDIVKELGYKSVSFEQYQLTDLETLNKMADSTRAFIMLSPESHDPIISRLAGRGSYTMSEMEAWIPKALDAGIAGVMVWFFIGMPKQTRQSVLDTVSYSERLLKKFDKNRVIPLICPMVPFLDPGSKFYEEPELHGYKIFHKTLEQHRQAMCEPLWYRRLNYETDWMSRQEIQDVTYEAISRLVSIKSELGIIRSSTCETILSLIENTRSLLSEIEKAIEDDGILPQSLRDEIRDYNRTILAHSTDQIVPISRPIGGRWFDDFTIPANMIMDLLD